MASLTTRILYGSLLLIHTCYGSINFVHIPKTGGTTLHRLLRAHFAPSEIYPYGKVGLGRAAATTQEQMESAWNEFPNIRHQLIGGHFPMWFFHKKDPTYDSSYFFTVLRDPVERVLSHDRYRIKWGLNRGVILEPNPLAIPSNFLCKMLCSDCTLQGEELIKNCMDSLDRMNYIIFMDDYENGVRNVFNELHIPQPKEIPHYNTTSYQPVGEEMIQQIQERNALDVQLYRLAKEKFSVR